MFRDLISILKSKKFEKGIFFDCGPLEGTSTVIEYCSEEQKWKFKVFWMDQFKGTRSLERVVDIQESSAEKFLQKTWFCGIYPCYVGGYFKHKVFCKKCGLLATMAVTLKRNYTCWEIFSEVPESHKTTKIKTFCENQDCIRLLKEGRETKKWRIDYKNPLVLQKLGIDELCTEGDLRPRKKVIWAKDVAYDPTYNFSRFFRSPQDMFVHHFESLIETRPVKTEINEELSRDNFPKVVLFDLNRPFEEDTSMVSLLPAEMVFAIFEELDFSAKLALCLTCTWFYQIIRTTVEWESSFEPDDTDDSMPFPRISREELDKELHEIHLFNESLWEKS